MTCEVCDDGEGQCVFPYYGVGPHVHKPGKIIRSTVLLDKPDWPDNYVEDRDCPGLGTYTNCPLCNAPGEPFTAGADPC